MPSDPAPPPRLAPVTTLDASGSVGRAGQLLRGRYELIARLGAGGMGEVWSARHTTLDKRVAIKLLHITARAARDRFMLEARLLAALKHEAVIEVFDFDETEAGIPYFVMELVDGLSLADVLDDGARLTVAEAVALGVELAAGLGAAHAAGVIHRDVKPGNVLLVRGPSGVLRPKIVDFGIALVRGDGAPRLTAIGVLVGTPEYMAPETVRGEESGPAADVWGLAITLYEAISNVSPFRSRDVVSTFRKVLDEPLPYPRGVPGFDASLWRVLARALQKEPGQRTATMHELGAELAAWHAPRAAAPSATLEARVEAPPRPPFADEEDEAPATLDDVIRKRLGRG